MTKKITKISDEEIEVVTTKTTETKSVFNKAGLLAKKQEIDELLSKFD